MATTDRPPAGSKDTTQKPAQRPPDREPGDGKVETRDHPPDRTAEK